MKICILGDGLLAKDFERLDYTIIDNHFLDFKIEYVLDYDVIINTHDYKCENDGKIDLLSMKKCNIDLPLLLSEFCSTRNKRYVHISTTNFYCNNEYSCKETDNVYATDEYTASKLFSESTCGKKDLVIRVGNLFNDLPVKDNSLFKIVNNSTPYKNVESFTWTVDIIRGIVSLLKAKQHGIFNIASLGVTSQAEICKLLNIREFAPTTSPNSDDFIQLNIDKLLKHIIPMNVEANITKCFVKMKEELRN